MDPLQAIVRGYRIWFDGPYPLRNLPWPARWKIKMLWSLLLERRTLFGMGQMVNLGTVHHPDWILQSICPYALWKYGVLGEDIENMETDLSDCIALTALYAMIKEGTAFLVASLLSFSKSVGHLSEFVGQAERERKGFSEQDCLGEGKSVNFLKGIEWSQILQDLIALNEVDKDLRSVQLCYCLLEISPTERLERSFSISTRRLPSWELTYPR